jgi:hypothetical protein
MYVILIKVFGSNNSVYINWSNFTMEIRRVYVILSLCMLIISGCSGGSKPGSNGTHSDTTEIPVLLFPADEEFIVRDSFYIYDWTDVVNADQYEIQYSDDETFQTPTSSYITKSEHSTSHQGVYTTAAPLFWRVRAEVNGTWASWSVVQNIYNEIDFTPVLLFPADEEFIARDSFYIYDWTDVVIADQYEIQYSDDETFQTPTSSYITNSEHSTSHQGVYTTAAPLFWRVRAEVNGTWASWSVVRSIFNETDFTPVLLFPTDEEFIARDSFHVYDWTDVVNADQYEIQYSEDETFQTPNSVYTTESEHNTSHQDVYTSVAPLYWRVRAEVNGTWTSWSVVQSIHNEESSAPSAINLSILGTVEVGLTLLGIYTYHDEDGDQEGISTFRWLRDGMSIPGAIGNSYVLNSTDLGAVIAFEVTPVSSVAPATGLSAVSPVTANVVAGGAAPSAITPSILGTASVGSMLTGVYTYNDEDGDSEGVSTFRWLRDGTAIAGATGNSYILVAADLDTVIAFEVTPMSSVEPATGVISLSPVTAKVVGAGAAPSAITPSILGTASVGSMLTGVYTYNDEDGDPEGVSTFRWLRDGTAIAGATENSYILVAADLDTVIAFEVTPMSSVEPATGVVSLSPVTAKVAG